MLCSNLGNPKTEAVYVVSHDLADFKVRSFKVYDGIDCFERENG